jgi:thioredoxin-related protein
MKRVFFLAVVIMALPALVMAGGKTNKTSPEPAAAPANDNEIHWITNIDELQAKMQQHPKKVIVDLYTSWCGWCKKMDAATYSNPALIKYVNNNFYAVRFDAERQDTINFQGKQYFFIPQYKANSFALEMLKGQMSYPTTVIMLENFQSPQPYAGYMTVPQMETILTFYGDNVMRHQSGGDYQKSYHPTWDHGAAPDMTPPPGH